MKCVLYRGEEEQIGEHFNVSLLLLLLSLVLVVVVGKQLWALPLKWWQPVNDSQQLVRSIKHV